MRGEHRVSRLLARRRRRQEVRGGGDGRAGFGEGHDLHAGRGGDARRVARGAGHAPARGGRLARNRRAGVAEAGDHQAPGCRSILRCHAGHLAPGAADG